MFSNNAHMKHLIFVVFVLLATLLPTEGRVLLYDEDEDDEPVYPPDRIFQTFSHHGRFKAVNLFVYKHTWATFSDFGSECKAYVNVGGLLLDSPYLQGDVNLQMSYSSADQWNDVGNVLCGLMRSGENKALFSLGAMSSSGIYFYTGDGNQSLFLEGDGISLVSFGGGTIHFSGCSC